MANTASPFSSRMWSAVEALPADVVRHVQDERLVKQLRYLKHRSAFYSERLRDIDVHELRGVEELPLLPFTDKHELRDSLAAQPPLGRHLAAPLDAVVQVQASSGTTGSPSYVGLTQSDLEVWKELGARAMYANGIRPGHRVLHAFGLSKGFVGGLPMAQILHHLGACEIPIGAEAGAERLLRVMADQRPDALVGTPHFVRFLGEVATQTIGVPADRLGVRVISVGGEPGGGLPAVREGLSQQWSATVREMLGGTDLACTYWGECEQADGMHLLSPDLMVAELIDPVDGRTLTPLPGASGELVYTALRREASPVLRFRTRDHIVVTGIECPCGRTGWKIRCVGRTDDMLIVRGINVFPSAIQDLVTAMRPETTGAMRVIADFDGHSTQRPLRLRVERGMQVADEDALAGRIADRIRGALNFRPQVELVDPGVLDPPGAAKVALVQREPTA